MREAIRLARRGAGRPSSEPLAGAVVVENDRAAGRAYAGKKGADAAIIAALDESRLPVGRATIYTNICPCLDASNAEECISRLIKNRPARILIGTSCNSGRQSESEGEPSSTPDSDCALEPLREAGIEVATGLCEEECREANEIYFKYRATGQPFITVKFAETLDGRIATATGDSQWISSPASLRLAHQLRREHDGIMVGIGTVIADDPQLTVRLVDGRDPLRIIIDSRLRIPDGARVLAGGAARHTLIAATASIDAGRADELESLGAEVLRLSSSDNASVVDLIELLDLLGRRGIASVLVEGGAGIITSLLSARRVDRMIVAIAPKIIGRGTEAVGDLGITRLGEAITFSSVKTRRLGPDIIFDGRLPLVGVGNV